MKRISICMLYTCIRYVYSRWEGKNKQTNRKEIYIFRIQFPLQIRKWEEKWFSFLPFLFCVNNNRKNCMTRNVVRKRVEERCKKKRRRETCSWISIDCLWQVEVTSWVIEMVMNKTWKEMENMKIVFQFQCEVLEQISFSNTGIESKKAMNEQVWYVPSKNPSFDHWTCPARLPTWHSSSTLFVPSTTSTLRGTTSKYWTLCVTSDPVWNINF